MNFRDDSAFHVIINLTNEALICQQKAILAEKPGKEKGEIFWMRPWLAADLTDKLRVEDTSSFFKFMRMEPAMFDEELQKVTPRISKNDIRMRKALEPGLKLTVTLRYLASGDNYSPRARLECHHIVT